MKRICTIFLVLLSITAFSQSGEFVETNSAKKSLMVSQQFINDNEFEKAARQLKHTIKIKDDFAVAWRELARVYLELGKYTEAIEAYNKSFELDEKLSRAAFFECGEAYFKLSDTQNAELYYKKYMDMEGKRYANADKEHGMEFGYDLELKTRYENLEFLKSVDTLANASLPINLDKQINSPYDDYLPTITSDGLQLIFTRTQRGKDENVMTSVNKKGEWSLARQFGPNINTKENEGMAKFETHGKAFYFAGCQRPDTEGGCDIYKAEMEEGEVSDVYRLEGQLNSSYWDSQPTITCDGRVMYFCSTRKGGFGGADIYQSILQPDDTWSIPQNMGPKINTAGDEEAPFISSDGKAIYYSSTGHKGMGEGDIFISRLVGHNWTDPVNLGYPINSPDKELGFYVQGNGKTAFFASRRNGGRGGLDIYKVELPEHLRPEPTVHLEGYIKDAQTGEAIQSTVLIGRENLYWPIKSDEDGWYFICLPGNKGYSFQVTESGYESYIEAQFLESQDNVAPILVDILLEPTKVVQTELVKRAVTFKEKRIQFFFGFDSYELNKETEKELVALVNLLQKEEDWKVEVVGYADSVGDTKYNLELSEKRAKTIVDFLRKSGIRIQNVIRNEGRGSETTDGAKSDKSRRVDVILRK